MSSDLARLSIEELEAEAGAVLPAKEVLSVPLLDLNVDLDLALALAAPIDLAVAANANVALPIDAAVSANALSALSSATAVATQGVMIDQFISGEAIAEGEQTSVIDQTDSGATGAAAVNPAGAGEAATPAAGATAAIAAAPVADATQPTTEVAQPETGSTQPTTETQAAPETVQPAAEPAQPAVEAETPAPTDVVQPAQTDLDSLLEAGLLNLDVNVALDADIAAPIAGAVAANANVAAPIDAAVAANIGAIGSEAIAAADQTAIITQRLEDVTAHATVDQDSEIDQ
jgi:hypothetical protein